MESKKIYYGFDLLKILMALLIVATHSSLFIEYKEIYNYAQVIYSLAVPTFFSISTFIYGKKIIAAENKLEAWKICKKDIIRLLYLCFFWIIVDFPMTYSTFFSIANWKEIVFCIVLTDPIRGLWFMKALIINKLLIFFFRKRLRAMSIVSLLIFVIFSLGYTDQFGGFSHPLHSYFSFYFHTFFCCIGVMFAKYPKLQNLRLDVCGLFLLIAFSLNVYNPDFGAIIWRIVCPFCFMSAFMCIKEPQEEFKPFYPYMRKISIIFYFLHFNFLWFYERILHLNENNILGLSYIRFFIVIISCFVISTIIIKLEKTKYCSFLRFSH